MSRQYMIEFFVKKIISPIKAVCFLIAAASLCAPLAGLCRAAEITDNPLLYKYETPPDIKAGAAVLAEAGSGRILYEKNMKQRMFPASLTKVMTALVALEYLELSDLITVGAEVNSIPVDSGRANHKQGEVMTAETLIRGLFAGSGNDTACVLAMETARRHSGGGSISYTDAEKLFSSLMNEKAQEIGARSTNFVNPHGYHDPRHYSTAYDLLVICSYALENPVIAEFAGQASFRGNGAGDGAEPDMLTQNYTWNSSNLLLDSGSEYYYPSASGIRTGHTAEAGRCLAAAAEKDDKRLICIILYSDDPDRWLDSAALFDYGFDSFDFFTVQGTDTPLGEVPLANVPPGANSALGYYAETEYIEFMSKSSYEKLARNISFNPELIYESGEDPHETALSPPFAKNDIIGTVSYTIGGELLFTGGITAGESIARRNFNTVVDYYFERIENLFFTQAALPYWIIFFLVSGIAVRIVYVFKKNLKQRQNSYKFKKNLL